MSWQRMSFQRSVLIVLMIVLGGAGSLARPAVAQELKAAELAGSAVAFALDPQTGNFVGVDPGTNTVALYSGELKSGGKVAALAKAEIPKKPATVVYKQTKSGSYFVVGCLDEPKLYVLETAKLKVVAEIPTSGSPIMHLGSARTAEDPYVYYCAQGSENQLGRVDIERKADQGFVCKGWYDCAISASGKTAYTRSPGHYVWTITENAAPGGKPIRHGRTFDASSPASFAAKSPSRKSRLA